MLFIPLPLHQLRYVCWGSICLGETLHLCTENKGLANMYCKSRWDSVGGAVPAAELADG